MRPCSELLATDNISLDGYDALVFVTDGAATVALSLYAFVAAVVLKMFL